MTSSIGGLVSGMDTATIVSQLMKIEARPQTLLKNQLTNVKAQADAYRDINTSFAALATAAQALTKAATWTQAKATSSSSSVTASTTAAAQPGSLTFSVDQLATTHSMISSGVWGATSDPSNLGSSLSLTKKDGTVVPITVGGTGTLADVVSAINAAGAGVTAAAVSTTTGYKLQVTATATGDDNTFDLDSADSPGAFKTLTQGKSAQITVGTGTTTYQSKSNSNTFTDMLPGVSFTVSQTGGPTTITIASDPDAVTKSVQSFVDAANAVLSKISRYTDSKSTSSAAVLKGDWPLTDLARQVLEAVSTGVGASATSVGTSASAAGLQLTREGTLKFDATAFKAKLAADPAGVQKIFSGTTLVGADNVANTPDDQVGVDGLGARFTVLAAKATDSAAGILTSLAKGQDTRAKDIQDQIDNWDMRLQMRQTALTAQFTAMESALSTLKSQSSWLSQQLNALTPSKSS